MPLILPDLQRRIMRRRRLGARLQGPVTQPPFDTANNLWSFDPDGVGAAQYVTGPSGTVTTPTKTTGAPSYYTYGATDFIDFGNSLNATLWDFYPYTIYACIAPTAADIAAGTATIMGKDDGASQRQFVLYMASGVVTYYAFSTLAGTVGTNGACSAALAAGRHVVALTCDLTQAVGSRLKFYIDGSLVAMGAEGGNGAVQQSGTAALRVGSSRATLTGVSVGSYGYAYKATHSAGTVSSITSWLQNQKGWV